ncbi:ATP-binding protein [Roseateles chitosanitabidus]|uniref:ATP-binding protein n=1 Tax=Roseateles chitosanitabidus TaxID=65048 RepID=UPI00082A4728|nr:ATP-binding protein [Roseateles chitosanitabidus]
MKLSRPLSETRALRRWIAGVGSGVIVAFAASSAYDAWRLHQQVSQSTARELSNLARALSEEAERSLQAVDLLLTDTSIWYRDTGAKLGPSDIETALRTRVSATPQVSVLTVTDAAGLQRFRSRPTGEPLADVSDRPYFQAQRDSCTAGMFINPPIVTRSEGRPALVVSRRLETPAGHFAGVVTAIVTLDELREVYDAIDLGAASALLLTFDDGRLVVRQPPDPRADGRVFHDLTSAQTTEARVELSPVDGRRKYIVSLPVSDRPLVMSVTKDFEDAMAPWRAEMWGLVGRTLVLVLVGLLTISLLLRQLRRVERDQAAREQLEAQLRQAQHMESLGTLAGGIAHDFNNILGAILGHGEMAQRRAGPDADLNRHLDRIMQAGARAKLLVRRILDFSRSGVHDRSLLNVDQAVEEALQLVAPTLPAAVTLALAARAGSAGILGDVLQMQQLVSNLCSNAVGAMPEGGRLAIEVDARLVERRVLLSHGALAPGRYVELRVTDTGTGMPEVVYARMFDPFFSTKAVGEGTGLGLSVVHSIVSDMGGVIDVRTEPGRGSSFALWFPVAGEAPRQSRDREAEAPPRGEGQTLLLVDDEAPLVEFAEELLAELGYEPVGFTDSAAALEAFERAPARFDAVLTDETMPGLSGVELTRRLLALRPGLPVLVMSGYGGEELEAKVAAAGARALVRKPLNATELAQAVAAVVTPSAAAAAAAGSDDPPAWPPSSAPSASSTRAVDR